jgi:hypothetical protein
MAEMTASCSTAASSSSVIARDSCSMRGLIASSTATATPVAPAIIICPLPASAPSVKVTSAAISVVAPTWPALQLAW